MTDPQIAVLMLGLFIVAIMLGFPICFTLVAMGVGFGYYAYYDPGRMPTLLDNRVFDLLVNQTYSVMANDVLTAVPLFLFMGYIVERASIVDRLFVTLQLATRHLPGSMAIAALATCALFATATGIVGAVVTLMGLLAFPAMLKARYNTSFASGVICAGGCLGILIPPSIMLIVYAATSNVSVVRLYAGAIIPGFMLAGLYMLYVVGVALWRPSMAPKPREEDVAGIGFLEMVWRMMSSFFPLAFLILSVLGAILFGLATPSEAASMGALGGLVLAIAYHIAAVRNGTAKPVWGEAPVVGVNVWFGAIGLGGLIVFGLFLGYFVVRVLANWLAAAPLPEPELPLGPGVGIALSLALGVALRLFGASRPLLARLLPRSAAFAALFAFGGQGAAFGLVVAVIYAILMWPLDLQQFFAYHERTIWCFDIGFFVGLLGYIAWKATDSMALRESVYLTVRTSAMVCWLFVGSWTFSSVFSYLGGEQVISTFVTGSIADFAGFVQATFGLAPEMVPVVSTVAFLILAQLVIFLLGWPLEWSEIIIIFVPIFLPMLGHFNVDPLFFGILVALNLQTSFLTPPMAMAAYYLKGVAPPHVQLIDIFKGVMPYLFMVILAMIILYIFPEISSWLPDTIYGKG